MSLEFEFNDWIVCVRVYVNIECKLCKQTDRFLLFSGTFRQTKRTHLTKNAWAFYFLQLIADKHLFCERKTKYIPNILRFYFDHLLLLHLVERFWIDCLNWVATVDFRKRKITTTKSRAKMKLQFVFSLRKLEVHYVDPPEKFWARTILKDGDFGWFWS